MTDLLHQLEECIENIVEFTNENGGFTLIRWYRRGSIADRTILKHNSNDTHPRVYNKETSQVDNSSIVFSPMLHPSIKY